MAKASAGRPVAHAPGRGTARPRKAGTGRTKAVPPDAGSAAVTVSRTRFEAIMEAARQSGLLGEKDGRIGGRVSPALVRQAKRQTGIQADTDLIEFALATVALEDHFAEAFKDARGKVEPGLKLSF